MKKWNKNDKRYNDDGFFNLSGYMELVGFDWTKNLIMLINCERNNGKSVGGWNYIIKEIWEKYDHKWRVLYCRTTLEQLDKARKDFNIAYHGVYYMSTTHIFKIKCDDNGKDLINERIEIGAIAAISTQINNKSMRFDNYHYIFWDEYNDVINRIGIYAEFTNLIKTVQRFTEPFAIVLIGNKDNANNEFMVKWGIEIDGDNDDDTIIILDSANKKNIKAFIDVGNSTFKHLNQKTGLANEMAIHDNSMNRYLNLSGYRNKQYIDVINYDMRIAETAKPLFYLLTKKCTFEVGDFEHHKAGNSKYIRMVEQDEQLLNLHTYTATALEAMELSSSIVLENDEAAQILEIIYTSARKDKLFYTSFDAKIIMEIWYASIFRRAL